jgi:hypothetical protein
MTSIVSIPARTWVGAHRVFMIVVAFVITLAAATTFVLLTAPSEPSSTTTVPVQQEELTDTQRACELARVVGC